MGEALEREGLVEGDQARPAHHVARVDQVAGRVEHVVRRRERDGDPREGHPAASHGREGGRPPRRAHREQAEGEQLHDEEQPGPGRAHARVRGLDAQRREAARHGDRVQLEPAQVEAIEGEDAAVEVHEDVHDRRCERCQDRHPAIPVPEPAEEQEDESDQQARDGELRQERQVREQPRRRPRRPAGGEDVAVGVGAHEGDVCDHEAEECFRAGAPRLRPSPPESRLSLHAAPSPIRG